MTEQKSDTTIRSIETPSIRSRVSRRTLVKGALGTGAAVAASTRYSVPMIARQTKAPVLFWTAHTADSLAAQQKIVDAFNAQSQDTEVTLTQIPPGDVTDSAKLITAVRGGTGPDVYFLDRFIVAERAANGLLQDLTPLIEAAGENPDLKASHIEFTANEATWDGKPFALPFDTDVRALYYNKQLLQAGGVDPAEFDPANGPMLWDRVKEIAISLNKADSNGNFSQVGFVPGHNQGQHYTYGFSWGGNFFNQESCEVTPNDEKVVEAGTWVYNYNAEVGPDKLQAFIQAAERDGAPPTDNPFVQKRLAMMLTGDWYIATMANYAPDVDYGITFIPVPSEGMESTTWAGGWSAVVPQGAKQPEAAYRFMSYFCGPEGQKSYTVDTTHVPTLTALQADKSLFQERHQFFVNELLPTTRNRPPLPVGAKYWDELETAWDKIQLNTEEAGPALETAKNNTQGQLGQFCPIG